MSRKGGAGQGEVGEFTIRLKKHNCLGLRVEWPLLALGDPFLSSILYMNGLRKQISQCKYPISGSKAFSQSEKWSHGKSKLRCGLSHKCVEDGCKGTCVKFGA